MLRFHSIWSCHRIVSRLFGGAILAYSLLFVNSAGMASCILKSDPLVLSNAVGSDSYPYQPDTDTNKCDFKIPCGKDGNTCDISTVTSHMEYVGRAVTPIMPGTCLTTGATGTQHCCSFAVKDGNGNIYPNGIGSPEYICDSGITPPPPPPPAQVPEMSDYLALLLILAGLTVIYFVRQRPFGH